MAYYTGSFSGSYIGNGSGLTDIDYYELENLPTTITPFQKNSILANTSLRDNFVSNVKDRLNEENVISGSVLRTFDGTGVLSGSAQIAALGYLTSETDSQTLTLAGNNLSISNGNSVSLAGLGGGSSGGASIWNTGSQDPEAYTHLMTSNNLQVTGSVDIKGDFTVNGQSVFTQTSASDVGNALIVKGRIKVLEEQIGSYIASASIQIGNSQDTIDCGGFF